MISLADSQVLRWIDEINGVYDAERRAREIKRRIRDIHKAENCAEHKRLLRALYAELDKVQFKPDYMCLIIDKDKDYYRANKGFMINGVKYERLLGTAGGIKNRTIVYVSKAVAPEIKRRIDNGRDMTKELVPAKLEAYKALACSATIPVSMPAGVLVVPDCETQFYSDIIYLSNEDSDEPIMEEREHELIELTESDGYGLMLPSLAKRSALTIDEIENNFRDIDFFSGVMDGLQEALAYKKGKAAAETFVRKKSLPAINVAEIRFSLSMTQKAFAEILGVSCRTVEAWESNKSTPSPTAKKLMFLIQEDHSLIKKL